jgi:hypothetical protein
MILEAVRDEDLKVYVVWSAVLEEDVQRAAVNAMGYIPDQRAVHFWDADKSLALSLGKVITLPGEWDLAWDVYLAFDRRSTWNDLPPKPNDWMHQLGYDERRLDGAKLRTTIESLLKTTD